MPRSANKHDRAPQTSPHAQKRPSNGAKTDNGVFSNLGHLIRKARPDAKGDDQSVKRR